MSECVIPQSPMTLLFLKTNAKMEAKITFLLISDRFLKNTFGSFPNESQNYYLNCLKGTMRKLLLNRNFYVSNFIALIILHHTMLHSLPLRLLNICFI